MEVLTISVWTLALLIFVALAFDFMNGFHDGANSISTIVATGALTPRQAVAFAAFFNFAALWIFHLKVAATIGKGTVDPQFVDHYVIFGALCGALAWNIITWYYGIPSSSSHALIGGLVGATVANAGGVAPIIWSGFGKILIFIIISPLVGFLIGGLLMVAVAWVFRNTSQKQAGRWFNKAQLVAAAAYSLGHGGNDAQKTIGIIWLLLITAGAATTDVSTLPNWVIYSCYGAIAWGTYLGGWRIVEDHGFEDHPADAGQRFLRLDERRIEPGPGDAGRRAGVHHAHDHRCHRRRGHGTGREGRALGRDLQPGVCLDRDHSRRRPDSRDILGVRTEFPGRDAVTRHPDREIDAGQDIIRLAPDPPRFRPRAPWASRRRAPCRAARAT